MTMLAIPTDIVKHYRDNLTLTAGLKQFTGEDWRKVQAAYQGARWSAAHHPDNDVELTAAQLHQIGERAALEILVTTERHYEQQDQSKPRRVNPAHGSVKMTVAINGTPYTVIPIVSQDPAVTRCYELRKERGGHYHVSQHPHGAECTCPDFEFNRKHRDPEGCKHVRSLQAFGMVEASPAPVGGGTGRDENLDDFPRTRPGATFPAGRKANWADDHRGLDSCRSGHPA